MTDIVIPQEIPHGMTQEDARKEITVLHDVLRHGDLRPNWNRSSLDGSSAGVFYNIGPLRTRGLTIVQYYELVRLAKAGLLAKGSAQ